MPVNLEDHTHTRLCTGSWKTWEGHKLSPVANLEQHIKKIIYHNHMRFIQEMQGYFNILRSINVICHIKIENKSWSSQQTQKSIWQNPITLYDKNTKKTEGNYLNLIKGIYKKHTATITLYCMKDQILPSWYQEQGKDFQSYHCYSWRNWKF